MFSVTFTSIFIPSDHVPQVIAAVRNNSDAFRYASAALKSDRMFGGCGHEYTQFFTRSIPPSP